MGGPTCAGAEEEARGGAGGAGGTCLPVAAAPRRTAAHGATPLQDPRPPPPGADGSCMIHSDRYTRHDMCLCNDMDKNWMGIHTHHAQLGCRITVTLYPRTCTLFHTPGAYSSCWMLFELLSSMEYRLMIVTELQGIGELISSTKCESQPLRIRTVKWYATPRLCAIVNILRSILASGY